MTRRSRTCRRAALVAAILIAGSIACGGAARRDRPVVRITGSDTMVNLVQAWAEHYREVRPAVSVQVAGGGSGVGIAALIDGTCDLAAASRELKPAERERARARLGTETAEHTVAFDALAVYVHKDNPLCSLSIDELAEIYGEGGRLQRWSQLAVANAACKSDRIIRIGRQNNSGTYTYFRDVVLGSTREYELGSIDQSGSKDVVALTSRTPCAIGYSGIAFATSGVKPLAICARAGAPPVNPSIETVLDRSYPIARPLYLYASSDAGTAAREFVDWVLGTDGQRIVRELGMVPVRPPPHSGPPLDEQ